MNTGNYTTEHQSILRAFKKFQELSEITNNKITENEDILIREGIAELRKLHNHFHDLLSKLQTCTSKYEKKLCKVCCIKTFVK